MYLADPVAGLRAALRALRDDGLAVFYEWNTGSTVASLPVSPLHQLLGRCINETYARGGLELAMGMRLYEVFLAAGLEAPRLCSDALIGGGRDWVERFAWYGASTLRSLLPLLLRYGVATEEELAIETFEQRYREEVLGQGSVVQWLTCVEPGRASAPPCNARPRCERLREGHDRGGLARGAGADGSDPGDDRPARRAGRASPRPPLRGDRARGSPGRPSGGTGSTSGGEAARSGARGS